MILRRFASCILISFLFPQLAAAGWRSHPWRGGPMSGAGWSHGYWFHGNYGGRAGWWWVVGPIWYYYPSPTYPYPSEGTPAGYYVQVSGGPPPPIAGTPTASPALPPTSTATPDKSAKAMSYYCEKSKSYYPVVTNCDGAWIATPVQPPKP